MKSVIIGASGLVLALGVSTSALAFDCPNRFAAAEAAIAKATAAMNAVSDKTAKGLVHTFIDDAKMLLSSGKHNHEKPAASKYDHARAIGKANRANGLAEAAEVLASKS